MRKLGSVKRGECEEGGDSEWRDRFGGVDWIFLAFEFESLPYFGPGSETYP